MGFFSQRKPRQFAYRPLYYDRDKEARDRRRDEILGAKPVEGDYVPGSILRGRAQQRLIQEQQAPVRRKKSLYLWVVAIALILFAVWLYS